MASKAKAIAAKSAKSKAGARKYKMYINGEFVEAHSGGVFPVYNPSTEEIIAEVPEADEKDVDRAVAAAKAAFNSGAWPQTTAQDRGRILFRLAERIRKEAAHLADLECRNSGKPIVEAEYDIADAATCFEYYGGMATKVLGHVNPVPDNALSLSLREPIGIAAQIIPWNYPLLMAAWKLAPAIAAGCCCVLKPAEQTPLTALEFAGISHRRRIAARSRQHHHRVRRRRRRAAGKASRRKQSRVHRQRGSGQSNRENGCGYPETRDSGTRREIAQHIFCGRGF